MVEMVFGFAAGVKGYRSSLKRASLSRDRRSAREKSRRPSSSCETHVDHIREASELLFKLMTIVRKTPC